MANANGEGSIYKRMRDGRHVGYIGATSYADDTGQPKRHMVYGKTRTDVRGKMKEARERLDNGAAVKDSKRTLADWLAYWRVTTLAVSDRKESTKELYANLCRRHLEPEPFGAIRLAKLRPSDVEALVLAMRAKTKPGKRTEENLNPEPVRALSDATIRQTYTVLPAGLDGAVPVDSVCWTEQPLLPLLSALLSIPPAGIRKGSPGAPRNRLDLLLLWSG